MSITWGYEEEDIENINDLNISQKIKDSLIIVVENFESLTDKILK